MPYLRCKRLLMRLTFMSLVIFSTFISPHLCQLTSDYEEMDVEVRQHHSKSYKPTDSRQLEPSCEDNFCENVANYPIDAITNAIKDIPNSAFNRTHGDLIDLLSRLNSPADGESLCKTTWRTVYPRRSKNIKNKVLFIVNTDTKKQGVVMRECIRDTNKGCGRATFPAGYIGECTQKYAQVNLLAYDADGAKFDTFSVPSCCVCSLKNKRNG